MQERTSDAVLSWSSSLLQDEKVKRFSGLIPPEYIPRKVSINVREAYAMLFILERYSHFLQNQYVDVYTDSHVIFDCIARKGKSNTKEINDILIRLWRLCRNFNMRIIPHHISGKLNGAADEASRRDIASFSRISDKAWTLIQSASRTQWNIDGLATAEDTRCARYISYSDEEDARQIATNLFSYRPSGGDCIYLYPPFKMIAAVVRFMERCSIPWVIVVPRQHENWWIWLRKHASFRILLGQCGSREVYSSWNSTSGTFLDTPSSYAFYAFFFNCNPSPPSAHE